MVSYQQQEGKIANIFLKFWFFCNLCKTSSALAGIVLKLLSFLPTKLLLTCFFSSSLSLPESLTLLSSVISPFASFPLNLKDTVFLTAFIRKFFSPILPCNHKSLLALSLLPSWASYQPFLAFPTSLSPFPVSLYCTKPTLIKSPETQEWIIELFMEFKTLWGYFKWACFAGYHRHGTTSKVWAP